MGIDKSKEYIEKAELILFVLDSSKEKTQEDIEIYNSVKNKNFIILLNKTDLETKIDMSSFDGKIVRLSTKTGEGLSNLSSVIEEKFRLGDIKNSDSALIINRRHKEAIACAIESVSRAISALSSDTPYDLVSIDVMDTASHLGEITGKTVSEFIDPIIVIQSFILTPSR